MSIKIITDSTSDLDRAFAASHGVDILPLTIHFGEEEFRDGVDITASEFYKRLRSSKTLPTTSQVSPMAFEKAFREQVEAGHEVLAITIASKLSGTCQSAHIAKEHLKEGSIRIIDSETTSMGLALLVMEAVKAKDAGMSLDDIASHIEALKKRVVLYALFDTLEYLKKGGRLSSVSAALGALLNLKPMIDLTAGVVSLSGKARGFRKALQWILTQMEKQEPDPDYTIAFGHSDAPDSMEKLEALAKEKFPAQDPLEVAIGMTVGTHAGPGCVGVAYIAK